MHNSTQPYRRFCRLAIAVLIVSSALMPTRASAQQTPTATAPAPASDDMYIGAWRGTYSSDHAPSGAIGVKIERGTDLKLRIASMEVDMGGAMTPMPTRDLTVSPTDISWTVDMMGTACNATSILKDGKLAGSLVCSHGAITFTLTKA